MEKSIVGEGSEIYGKVYNSVIGCGVTIGKDTVVKDSIIMNNTVIGSGCEFNKAIVAENVVIEDNSRFGIGQEAENEEFPHIYNSGLVCIGEKSVIPSGITVGKNACIFGETILDDYTDAKLPSGKNLIKAGE